MEANLHRKPTRKWWRGYEALYGKGQPAGEQLELPSVGELNNIVKKELAKAKSTCPTEQQEQFVLAAWLRKKGVPFHHSPNGGYRDYVEAAKFKRLGTSPGFPDIFIPRARKGRYGLYIELKRVSGGRLSEHQEVWRDILIAEGYAWYEAKGADEAIRIVEDYLGC